MKPTYTSLLVSAILITLSSCFSDDDPLLPPEITDPCSIVHETYPNVGEDSCAFVLNLIENFSPPTTLPPATDTGGQLLAARILTDTGMITFVAGGIPVLPWSFATSCSWWQTRGGPDNSVLVAASYCRRPPIDDRILQLILDFDSSGNLTTDAQDSYATFRSKTVNDRFTHYVVTDTQNITYTANIKHENRIIHGNFSGVFYNEEDPTETIQVLDGRFDARF